MSASTCIVYFGLRFDVAAGDIEALEERSDARVAAARKSGLKYYWANFSDDMPKYLLFVGTEFGIIGPENAMATRSID
jgi:hypothetical protein